MINKKHDLKKIILLLLAVLLSGCSKDPILSEVIIGNWYLEHYEVYLDGNPTTNAASLDNNIIFFDNGTCRFNNKTSLNYTLSGNTIRIYSEKTSREYKVTYFTSKYLVWHFYTGKYKYVYYLHKC